MTSSGWGPNWDRTGVLTRRGRDTTDLPLTDHAHRGKATWGHSERWPSASHAGREPAPETHPAGTPIFDFSLQDFQKIRLCCLTTQSVVFCYGSSSRQTQHPKGGQPWTWRRTGVLCGEETELSEGRGHTVLQSHRKELALLCDVSYFCPWGSVIEIVDSDKKIGSRG